jgi:hypothetical protein
MYWKEDGQYSLWLLLPVFLFSLAACFDPESFSKGSTKTCSSLGYRDRKQTKPSLSEIREQDTAVEKWFTGVGSPVSPPPKGRFAAGAD